MTTTFLRRPKLELPVFAQRDGTVRLGWRPEESYVVTPPTDLPGDVMLDLLRRLDGVHSRAHMVWYAGTVGLSANRMSTLLAELSELGLLTEGNPPLDSGRDDVEITIVRILGRGPIGDAIIAGFTPSAAVVLQRSMVKTSSATASYDKAGRCDLAVLSDEMMPDPGIVTTLLQARTPHLQVRLRDGLGVVGPFVLPGSTSCLRCADLLRCSLDPQWPHVSAQLLGRVGSGSKPTVLAAAAVALAQIESFLHGRHDLLTDTTVEIDTDRAAMTRRTWSTHPACECSVS